MPGKRFIVLLLTAVPTLAWANPFEDFQAHPFVAASDAAASLSAADLQPEGVAIFSVPGAVQDSKETGKPLSETLPNRMMTNTAVGISGELGGIEAKSLVTNSSRLAPTTVSVKLSKAALKSSRIHGPKMKTLARLVAFKMP